MSATPRATRTPVAIGIVGLTPTLAESLRPLLRAAGYDFGPLPDTDDALVFVTNGSRAEAPMPDALVVLDPPGHPPAALPAHLPIVAVAAPFVPERMLAVVAGVRREVELRQGTTAGIARAIGVLRESAAICDDLHRAPAEVAAALAALLRGAGGYDRVSVVLDRARGPVDESPGESVVQIPLLADGEPVGHLHAAPPRGPGDPVAAADHRRLLETMAGHAGTYLTRRAERARVARLRTADARRVLELATLNEVALVIASLDLDQVLEELLPRTRALLGADSCLLVLRDAESDALAIRAADGLDADRLVGLQLSSEGNFSRRIVETQASQRWRRDDAAAFAAIVPSGAEPYAAIGAPLLVQDRAIGAIVAANRRTVGFAEADLRFLTTVAAQAAIAVENARRYADTLRLAHHDALTGLANRRYFLEELARAVATAARYDRPLALLIIDLDYFKAVNDAFGHLAGDTILRAVAERIGARLRRSDFLARYAGDELVAILPETALPGALALAERLRVVVAETPFPTGEAMPAWLTLSVGVAAYSPGTTVTDFLRAADSALYFAKHEGRNQVCGPAAAQVALTSSTADLATILRGGNQAVIEELAAAVDARVAQTAGQAALVASVAAALGETLGLADDALGTLRAAALVHDLGEVAVAPDLLGRAGPLDARELALVRDHPRRSHELLAAVPAFQGALPLILHHHERWDGGGYPDGLAGEAIPLGARILAVADAWVALTTDRPYRAALPIAEALAEIARGAGTQFDPAVAAAVPQAIERGARGTRHG